MTIYPHGIMDRKIVVVRGAGVRKREHNLRQGGWINLYERQRDEDSMGTDSPKLQYLKLLHAYI
jgi:hypothetical protein